MKNYYEILEVNPKASKEVIEKAYRVLAKKYHPDLYIGEKKEYAERKIKEINAAYNILSDEFLREQYDSELKKQNIEYTQNYYQGQKKQNIFSNNYRRESQEKPLKQQRTSKVKVGTLGSMIDLTKQLVNDLARNKEKRRKTKLFCTHTK